MRFEKEFTPYPHFIVFDFEAILAALNEHPKDDLRYLSRHIQISVAVQDTLSKGPVFTEKQEAIAEDALKQHPYLSDF